MAAAGGQISSETIPSPLLRLSAKVSLTLHHDSVTEYCVHRSVVGCPGTLAAAGLVGIDFTEAVFEALLRHINGYRQPEMPIGDET